MFCSRSGSDRPEGEGHAIHAIAQPGRLGAVIKDVTEMAATPAAVNCGSQHAEARVLGRSDSPLERRPEARPSSTTIVLRGRGEKIEIATRTGEVAATLFMEQRAGEGALGRTHA